MVRRTVATVPVVFVLLSVIGCDRQQVTISEAYHIPQPKQALLHKHARPTCDFGAPNQLPVKAADTWTPYSGQPETRRDGETPSQPTTGAPETVDAANTYALLAKERDCYREAEATARKKLHRLQVSVDNTLTALQQETRHRARHSQNARQDVTTQHQ